jgi:hypothetical protein
MSNLCVKCGFNPPNGGLLSPPSRRYNSARDAIVRQCFRCGYSWDEPTADKMPAPELKADGRGWLFWRTP